MRKNAQAQPPQSEKPTASVTPALVTALTLLSASLGLSVTTDVAMAGGKHSGGDATKSTGPTTTRSKTKTITQDVTVNKQKTASKKAKEMDDYIKQ